MDMQSETKLVLTIVRPVPIAKWGITLPAGGVYPGRLLRRGTQTQNAGGRVDWADDRHYQIELSTDELVSMGAKNVQRDLISDSIDVGQFVQSGDIISRPA